MQEVIKGVSVLKHPEVWSSGDAISKKVASCEKDYGGFIQVSLIGFLKFLQCFSQKQERHTWFQRKV